MQQIGRYQIVRELGRGAMGIVYQAEDPAIGRTIAIKTIRLSELTESSERERVRERLLREARSAGILSHPGIITIYDVMQQEDMAYIFMEFVDGPTLEKIMTAEQPPAKQTIIDILRQTASALDYAHSKGIIHRDIKPANIMVSTDGAAKIADFGVAKILSQQMTQAGTIMGTPNYMSPEQIQGSGLDGRSDQFALAVISYELLTGEKPYAADSLPTLLYKIVKEPPVGPQLLNPTLGPEVETVLGKAMSKDPNERYSSCKEFVNALAMAASMHPEWRPQQRGSLAGMATVEVSAGTQKAAPVPPPEPVALKPEPPPTPAPTLAQEPVPVPRRRRLDDEEPKPALARNLAIVFVVLVAAGLGAYMGRDYFSLGQSPAAPPAATVPEALPPASTPPLESVEQRPSPMKEPAPAPTAPPVESTAPAVETPKPPPSKPAAAPREPAPPAELTIQARSVPPGATAVFDGNQETSCTTPCSLTLPKGRHTFTMNLAGYRSAMRIVEVSKDEELSVNLEQQAGTLMVKSIPTGASIRLNGRPRSEKTPAVLSLPAGSYKLELIREGFPNYEETIQVKDQVISNIEVNWTGSR